MESEGEEELCGSRSARDGGCTFCVLPFGHAGAHDLGRAKRVSKPPALFVEEQYGFVAEAQGYTLHLKRKRTENPPTPQTAPAQAEVPADPAAPAAPAPAAAAPATTPLSASAASRRSEALTHICS